MSTDAAKACRPASVPAASTVRAAALGSDAYVHTAVLGVDGLGQVGAILAEAAAAHNLVAEVKQVKRLINTVSVERVAPELLQTRSKTASAQCKEDGRFGWLTAYNSSNSGY
jgi:hypothetical protein